MGVTSYHSREFRVIPISDIEENAELFAGKCVLVGAMEDATDMHATPVNSYMAGLLIHAHAIATILDGTWYRTTPHFFDYLLAVTVCLAITLLTYSLTTRFKGIILRLIQVTLAYLAVRLGYEAFIDHNILFDFSYTLLIITFGFFAVDIWLGFEEIGRRIQEWLSKRKNQKICEKLS